MKLIYIILLLFFISLTQATIYFSNPTPLNNTSNFSYGLVFNITTDTGFICGTSRIEINGSNKTCTIAADNLSCAYTLSYADHVFNKTYSVIGYANQSAFSNCSGATIQQSNETRIFRYYGCGNILNVMNYLQGNISVPSGINCLTMKQNMFLEGNGYTISGSSFGQSGTGLFFNQNGLVTVSNFTIQNIHFNNLTTDINYKGDVGSASCDSITSSNFLNLSFSNSTNGFYILVGTACQGAGTAIYNLLKFNNISSTSVTNAFRLNGGAQTTHPLNWTNSNFTNLIFENVSVGFFLDPITGGGTDGRQLIFSNNQIKNITFNGTPSSIFFKDARTTSATFAWSWTTSNIFDNLSIQNVKYSFYSDSYFDNNQINNFVSTNASSNHIYANLSVNNTYSNLTLTNSSSNSIKYIGSTNNTFTNLTISLDNASFSILNSNITVNKGLFYNSRQNFEINNSLSSQMNINLTNILLDNASGNLQNYSNITLIDNSSNNRAYRINWSSNNVTLPSLRQNFKGNFFNISNVSGAYNISFTQYWLDSNLSGHFENKFELYRHNGSAWLLLNNTPNTTDNSLSIQNLNNFSIFGILEATHFYFVSPTPDNASNSLSYPLRINLTSTDFMSDCKIEIDGVNKTGTVSANNLTCTYTLPYSEHLFNHSYTIKAFANITTYLQSNETRIFSYNGCGYVNSNATLSNNIDGNNVSTCLTLNSSNLLLQGQGYNIYNASTAIYAPFLSNVTISNTSFSNLSAYAIYPINSFNISVINNTFTNISYSIYLSNSSNSLISDNVLFQNLYGISAYVSDEVNITNNNISNSSIYGIFADGSTSLILQNNISKSGYGIGAIGGTSNIINNTIANVSDGIYLLGTSELVNLTNNSIYDSTISDIYSNIRSLNITNNTLYRSNKKLTFDLTGSFSSSGAHTYLIHSQNWTNLPYTNQTLFKEKSFHMVSENYSNMTFYWEASELEKQPIELWAYSETLNQSYLLNSSANYTSNSISVQNNNISLGAFYGLIQYVDLPEVFLISPANNSNTSNSSIYFQFYANDNISSVLNCSIYIDDILKKSNSSTLNNTNTTFILPYLSNMSHTWKVMCVNSMGGIGSSSIYNILTLTPDQSEVLIAAATTSLGLASYIYYRITRFRTR